MSESKTNSRALSVYGERDEVRELSERIARMLPGVRQLGEAGALALAQVALSMDLNPFTGEVWAIPQKDKKTGKIVGFSIMAGVKGLRRAGKRQAREDGGVYPFYRPHFRMMSEEEKDFYDLKPGDKGLICELEIILPPSHPWYQSNRHERFIIEGVGIYRAGERTKMEPAQVARKRAESDALKIAFDLPFGDRDAGGDFGEADTIEGEYHFVAEEETPLAVTFDLPADVWDRSIGALIADGLYPTPLHVTAALEQMGIVEVNEDNLYYVLTQLRAYAGGTVAKAARKEEPDRAQEKPSNGSSSASKSTSGNGKRPLDPETVKARMAEKTQGDDGTPASEAQISLVATKGRECFAGEPDADLKYHTVLSFLMGLASSRHLTKVQARALLNWMLRGGKDDTGDYPLHADAPEEARRIIRCAMESAGQMDLFGTTDDTSE